MREYVHECASACVRAGAGTVCAVRVCLCGSVWAGVRMAACLASGWASGRMGAIDWSLRFFGQSATCD